MNLSEYSNYDGLGLAQLVKNKGLSAADANTNLDGDFAGVPLLLKDIGWTGAHSCTSAKSFQFAIEFSTNDALYRTQR